MLEAIGIKLITVLTGYLFETGLAFVDKVKIDSAPPWYYEEKNLDYIYVFSFKEGGIETLDPLKEDLLKKMEKKIDKFIETIIYKEFKNIKDPQELKLIKRFEKDDRLHLFVRMNTKFERIKQQKAVEKGLLKEERLARTFGSAILSKKALIEYQSDRIKNLREEMEKGKAKKAFNKLDGEFEMDEDESELEMEIPEI